MTPSLFLYLPHPHVYKTVLCATSLFYKYGSNILECANQKGVKHNFTCRLWEDKSWLSVARCGRGKDRFTAAVAIRLSKVRD